MLRATLIVLAVLAALVVVVAAVGWLLPRDHVASRSARFQAPPEVVFPVVASLEVGARDDLPLEIVERRPPDRLVTRIADPDLPFGGTWTFELAAEGAGTRLTITEHGFVSNPIFRAIARFVLGYEASMATYLRELGARLGEPAP